MLDQTKNNKRILVVEDENELRILYVEVLTDAGYIVDQAPTGDIAIEKIRNTNWDLLLLDIMLPGKDGLRILKDLSENPSLKKGPVIMLTNLNSDHIIGESFNSGADGYLIKSEITPDKIISEIASFLK
jgi:two-component system response regulator ResD